MVHVDTEVAPRRLPFPIGTKMVFLQSTPPVNWTLDVADNDRFLRVVNTVGGGTGGPDNTTVGTNPVSLSHSHTLNSHTHAMGTEGGHKHPFGVHTHPVYAEVMSTSITVISNNYRVRDTGGWFNRITDGRHLKTSVGGGTEGQHRHYCDNTGTSNLTYTGTLFSATGSNNATTGGASVSMSHDHSVNTNWRPKYIDVIIATLTN